jgi:hypothetical protein
VPEVFPRRSYNLVHQDLNGRRSEQLETQYPALHIAELREAGGVVRHQAEPGLVPSVGPARHGLQPKQQVSVTTRHKSNLGN